MLKININKKKILALLAGFMLTSNVNAEVISYDRYAKTTDGRKVMIYFMTGKKEDDYSFVTLNNQTGYIQNKYLVFEDVENYEYYELIKDLVLKEDTYIYKEPIFDKPYVITRMKKGEVVHSISKGHDGWYIVKTDQNNMGFIHEEYLEEINKKEKIEVLKVTGNNINVRSGPKKEDNVIGFADKSDTFEILGQENNYYQIRYLGKVAYISCDFGKIIEVDTDYLNVKTMVYLTSDTLLYNEDGNIISALPQYQMIFVLDNVGNYYKVRVDSVVGYIEKDSTKRVSSNCVTVDLGRQVLKVYKENNEVFRAHIISGRKSLQTNVGCFKIGHKIHDYQLTSSNFVHDWIQFNGNEGFHDASWQKNKYFGEVANRSYDDYSVGINKTYPFDHGSHGCINMKREDADILYNLVRVGDTVLIMKPNDLIKNRLISEKDIKIKKLV